LLDAAAAIFAVAGYEAATMSDIARKAGAPIGSLYQFFPNKQSLARALRTQYAQDYERLLDPLELQAKDLSLRQLVSRLVTLLAEFIGEHPASLSLLEAPFAAGSPAARSQVRERLAGLLIAHSSQIPRAKALRIASVMMQINRSLMWLYAHSVEDRDWLLGEFKAVLLGYLESRI
jgi:AcrR family transcriptional regulator